MRTEQECCIESLLTWRSSPALFLLESAYAHLMSLWVLSPYPADASATQPLLRMSSGYFVLAWKLGWQNPLGLYLPKSSTARIWNLAHLQHQLCTVTRQSCAALTQMLSWGVCKSAGVPQSLAIGHCHVPKGCAEHHLRQQAAIRAMDSSVCVSRSHALVNFRLAASQRQVQT